MQNVQLSRSSISATTCTVRNNLDTDEVPCIALAGEFGQGAVHEAAIESRISQTFSGVFLYAACRLGWHSGGPGHAMAEPAPAAVAAYNSYVGVVETRLAQQHRSQIGFLAAAALMPQEECACTGAS
jgi:hypothetical protein